MGEDTSGGTGDGTDVGKSNDVGEPLMEHSIECETSKVAAKTSAEAMVEKSTEVVATDSESITGINWWRWPW